MDQNRRPGAELPFESVRNFRDLGGYETTQGTHVRYGHFYRGPQLSGLKTQNDKNLFDSLGIHTDIDFRSTMERTRYPDPLPEGIRLVEASAILDAQGQEINFDPNQTMKTLETKTVEQTVQDMDLFYCRMPFQNPAYRRFFMEVREGHAPLYFHCTAGKDRTGVAAALLLLTFGVSRENVEEDYELSAGYREPLLKKAREHVDGELLKQPLTERFLRLTFCVEREMICRSLDAMLRVYGNFETYLWAELGIDTVERRRLQQMYTEA